jgi:hypothetical protein
MSFPNQSIRFQEKAGQNINKFPLLPLTARLAWREIHKPDNFLNNEPTNNYFEYCGVFTLPMKGSNDGISGAIS